MSAAAGGRGPVLAILERVSDAVIATDADGRVTFLNPAAERLVGRTRDESQGRPLSEVLRLVDQATGRAVPLALSEVPAGPGGSTRLSGGADLVRNDGRRVPTEAEIVPLEEVPEASAGWCVIVREIRSLAGGAAGAGDAVLPLRPDTPRGGPVAEPGPDVGTSRSVIDRDRGEESLRRSNQALRALIQASPLAIIALDGEGRVTIWNPAAERIFGWSEREVQGQPLPTIPQNLRTEFFSELATSSREDSHTGYETHRLRKDGSSIEIILWTAPLYDAQGAPCGRMGVVEDITERKRAEEARTALLHRIVTAQEEERLRIARELHDQMGQHLAALMLGLGAMQEHIRNPVAAAHARRMHDLTSRIGQEVHRIALELRPTVLDDWGLQTALSNYAAEWSRRARVPVQSRFVGTDRRRLPPEVETALYRTVQEALTNVLKHAGAGGVSLIVERRADHVLAIVEDDGRGFDVEAVMTAPDARGRLGLLGMQERVALVGGTLEIESSSVGGTSLFVRIPLAGSEEAVDHG